MPQSIAAASTACGEVFTGDMVLHVLPLPEPKLGNDTTLVDGDSIQLDAGDAI